ncbi:GNAT family N-acetyltransferase [Halomonas korlensis]|uniref:Acetyltransferase (GNAT) family protein n=1 Tax=Halomonas korlensis TaxID=463301 RepID=A0A1I7ILZ2_9GAMM|nr:GNAT family N-acetyltransferase [Halomonas korlensis]SFU73904.1 Acetyltransferase (GNAT) family protein [Halomonas korlensis]
MRKPPRREENIRIARLDSDSPHVALLAKWTHATWGHLHPGRSLDTAIAILRDECGAGGVPSVFAALHGDTPVGTASLVADDMSDRRDLTPWLASVFVPPEWRGQGVASRLVRRVEQEAQAHGHDRLYLYTPDQQRLYRQLGWRDLEARDYHGEAVSIMRRDVSMPSRNIAITR